MSVTVGMPGTCSGYIGAGILFSSNGDPIINGHFTEKWHSSGPPAFNMTVDGTFSDNDHVGGTWSYVDAQTCTMAGQWSAVRTIAIDLTGAWNGTWASSGGVYSGSLSVTLVQSGTSITGTATIAGSPCITSGSVSGTFTGNNITFGVVSGQDSIEFYATYASQSIDGTYIITAGSCSGEFGTFSMSK